MCWMCEKPKMQFLEEAGWGQGSVHFQSAMARIGTPAFDLMLSDSLGSLLKSTDSLWLTGHESGPAQAPALILIGDTIPDDTSTTSTLTVGGPSVLGVTETVGDQDFYKVELVAGQSYEIGMNAHFGGLPPALSGIPQADAYIEIYDAAGNFVTSADGGASTLYNNLNSGFDVLLTFTPETSGTFYVNARAYDEVPDNGTTGDTVGDYELFVREAAPDAYQPYYDLDSPLHSIDWGSQVDGTSRNPDGAEGPRPTGNDFTGHAWNPYGIEGKNVITYYFARQGEIFIDEDPTTPGTTDTIVASGFEDWEKDVYLNAFGAYSKVADIVYVEVQDRTDADFVLITYEGTPGPGVSLLGRMSPPDEENEGRTEFNAADERWTEEGLAPGGFSFTTLIHELGHGHGLAHPHDNGGRSSIMRGVESDGVAFSYTNGDFDLNQSIYTMMSYEDGWEKSPYGQAETTDPFGWLGSLMAFDVAAIQDKYGVNEEWAKGNDTYVLKDENAAGTFYSCIWDAGGTDKIVYDGAKDANIDLRAATLQYEEGGGGWVSYAFGIHGGFTIANGVTIENATSGSGNDTLVGNGVKNVLTSGAGNDTLDGMGGADRMIGGTGDDLYKVNNSRDSVVEAAGEGNDTVETTTDYSLAANVENMIYTGRSSAFLSGNGLDNLIDASAAPQRVTVNGGAGNDEILGGDGGDKLTGGAGDDHLVGNGGKDTLIGSSGADILDGGAAGDVFMFDQTAVDGSTDVILGFSGAQGDKVNLNSIDAHTGLGGNQAFTFIGGAAFSGTAGELRLFVDGSGHQVAAGDVNGDGAADFLIRFETPAAPVVAADFVL